MATSPILRGPDMELPWSSTVFDDQRFRRILLGCLVVMLVVSLPISFIQLPEVSRAQKEKLPPQLARVMLERKVVPPPPPKPEVKAQEPEAKPQEPEPVKAIPKPVEPPPRPEPRRSAEPAPVKDARPQPSAAAVTQARERASNAGVLQASNELAQMRDMLQTSTVAAATTATTAGANAGAGSTGQAERAQRHLIDSGARTTSGGINNAALSRDTGATALAGQQQTRVTSTLGDNAKQVAQAKPGNSDGAGSAARSEEEIRRVISQHKGAIDIIYQRALRQNAALQGKMLVKLVIDPSGRVLEATLVSSELGDTELENRILSRIRLISFPPSNVQRTTLNQTFDFFPQ